MGKHTVFYNVRTSFCTTATTSGPRPLACYFPWLSVALCGSPWPGLSPCRSSSRLSRTLASPSACDTPAKPQRSQLQHSALQGLEPPFCSDSSLEVPCPGVAPGLLFCKVTALVLTWAVCLSTAHTRGQGLAGSLPRPHPTPPHPALPPTASQHHAPRPVLAGAQRKVAVSPLTKAPAWSPSTCPQLGSSLHRREEKCVAPRKERTTQRPRGAKQHLPGRPARGSDPETHA